VTTVASSATFENTRLGVSAETDGTATTTYYVRDPRGGLLSERTPTGTQFYLLDGRGSVTGLVDSTGSFSAYYSYDPFGRLLYMSDTNGTAAANPWRFAGQYQDGTGLYHMGERYYDPSVGRFTQQDALTSILDPKQWNRYVYVGDDPINFVDSSGLKACASTGNTFLSTVFTIITVTSFILSFFAFFGLATVVTTFFEVSASTGLAVQVSAGFAAGALTAADTENRLCSGQTPSTSY
jgi:RHS repeat-associated protein